MSLSAPIFALLLWAAPVEAAEPGGQALAFSSIRMGTCLFEPRVEIGRPELSIHAGDVLEFDLLMPVACAERAGVELVLADGRRSQAPAVGPSEAWQHVLVPLDAFAEVAVARVELVARGNLATEIGYRVGDVVITHASAADPVVIFRETLAGGARIVRDDVRNAGAMIVRPGSGWAGVRTQFTDASVVEPWYAYDLTRLSGAFQADGGTAAGPRGDWLAGPCVPLRFTRAGQSAFVRATGQRLAFEPIEGGRYYTAWIAASLDPGPALDVHAFAFGDNGERRALEFEVPAPGDTDAVDLGGCFLIEVPMASTVPLKGIHLPNEPRLRLHALTFQWRRDGALDSGFRLDWLRHESESGAGGDAARRKELGRYVDDRTVAPLFVDVPSDEMDSERAIFDAAVSGDTTPLDERLKARNAAFAASGAPLKPLRIAFEEVRDDRSTLRIRDHGRSGVGVDGEALVLAMHALPAGRAVVIDGDMALVRQGPQILRSLGIGSALFPADLQIARWSGPDGSSVHLVGTSAPIGDARELGELAWRAWVDRALRGEIVPELFVPVSGTDASRADARALVKLLSRIDTAPRVRSATAEEFVAQAEKRLGAAEPMYAPGDVAPLDDDAQSIESIVRRRHAATAISLLQTFGTIAHADGAPAVDELVDELRSNEDASGTTERARAALEDQLDVIAHGATTLGAGTPIVTFNPLPWPRSTSITLATRSARLVGSTGKALASQPTADGGTLFVLDMPALGYEVLHGLRAAESEPASSAREQVSVEGWTARNDAIAFTIDPAAGALASLKVLAGDAEMLSGPAKLDGEGWKVDSAEFVERGPLRALARIELTSPDAHATLEMSLVARSHVLDVRCAITENVHGPRVAFAVPVRNAAERALVGVPFGSSPAAPAAEGSAARYGVLDWIAATDGTSGVGVLTGECAVAHVSSGKLSAELLAPLAPDTTRATTFALAPFTGGWKKAGLAQRAQELAMPVELFATDAHAGGRDARRSFVSIARVDREGSIVQGPIVGVTMSALQTTPDGDWTLRVVDTSGRAQDLVIEFDRPVFGAQRTDLRGTALGTLQFARKRVQLSLGAQRIENVLVRSKP